MLKSGLQNVYQEEITGLEAGRQAGDEMEFAALLHTCIETKQEIRPEFNTPLSTASPTAAAPTPGCTPRPCLDSVPHQIPPPSPDPQPDLTPISAPEVSQTGSSAPTSICSPGPGASFTTVTDSRSTRMRSPFSRRKAPQESAVGVSEVATLLHNKHGDIALSNKICGLAGEAAGRQITTKVRHYVGFWKKIYHGD